MMDDRDERRERESRKSVLVVRHDDIYIYIYIYIINNSDTAVAWKKSRFILSQRTDFHMIDKLSIAVVAFTMPTLTLISVDEMLPPRYVNCIHFRWQYYCMDAPPRR